MGDGLCHLVGGAFRLDAVSGEDFLFLRRQCVYGIVWKISVWCVAVCSRLEDSAAAPCPQYIRNELDHLPAVGVLRSDSFVSLQICSL